MSMEVNRVFGEPHTAEHYVLPQRTAVRAAAASRQDAILTASSTNQAADLDTVLAELQGVSRIFDRRLQFSVNRDLDQVVVKVIDKSTDRVIKEIPPAELQRVHSRIREAIGLFVDERI
ncbi:MAG: flagellar protein FlaG [Spirochaetaceae bacterium]|nr:MAG: flagellar protein FlaG [Spirochaetaceae bacterium]